MPASRPRISTAERRSRLGRRQRLASDALAASPLEASNEIVGFHATDPVSVYLAAWARVEGFRTGALETALYDERSLLKILGMRRTMFVVPIELAGIIQAACTDSIARGQRARLVKMIEGAGITDNGEQWLKGVEAETLEVLRRRGAATAAELATEVAGLREQIAFGDDRTWQGTVGVSTRLLFLLSAEGRIIRGRPKGTLVSSLYRWAPMDTWLGGSLATIPKDEAQAELVRRWLAAFGPGLRRDIQWWTGWTVSEVRRALDVVGAVEVDLEDGATAYALADDLDVMASPDAHWVALLPSLDPTTMGWHERDWYLGAHKNRLFDTNGNAGPTLWLDGRIVGGWAQRRDGEVVTRLLEDVGAEIEGQVAARANALQTWLGDLRVIARFRTPVEKELSA